MITHYVSLSSMIAGCCFPAFTMISPKVNESVPFVVFSFVIAILLLYTHRKNIERLRAGTESKIYIWKPQQAKAPGAPGAAPGAAAPAGKESTRKDDAGKDAAAGKKAE